MKCKEGRALRLLRFRLVKTQIYRDQLYPTALHVIEESCQILIETVAVVCKTIRHTSAFIFDDQNRSQVSESLKVSLERNTVFIHLSPNYDEPTACQLGVRVL